MKGPNLFIPGAPKAGTTFLYEALKNHPEVFFPANKELNHFAYDEIVANSYYNDYKVEDRNKFLKFFSTAKDQKILVDGSVSYFAYPSVAAKLFEYNPDAKIVISIRNPIKRSFSHFQMDKRMGNTESEFIDYIKSDKGTPRYIQYVQNSLYYENTMAFLKYFPKDQVKVMVLENLETELPSLFDFLKIQKQEDGLDADDRVNQNKAPRNFIAKYFQKNRKLATILKFIIPHKLVKSLNGLLYKPAPKEFITEEAENYLNSLFENDINSMSEFLNLDLTSIWNLKTAANGG